VSATVTVPPGFGWPVASVDLGNGRWLVMPISMPGPPANASLILGGWMLLIATGETIAAIAAARGVTPAEVRAGLAAATSIHRLVTADEVASVVAFLASPRSVAITGDAVVVGGGQRGPIHY
jgi:NAD(P)-dependent dehydrogenase (short-subunit alcohol dehydrogenase family)